MAFDLKTFFGSGGAPALGTDPVTALTNEVNRFNKAYGKPLIAATPGGVSADLATTALGLRQAQLSAAVIQFPTDASVAQQLAEVAAAQANPIPYVSANLSTLAAQLRLYADATFGTGWSKTTWALIATTSLVVVGGLFVAHQHRKMRRLAA